MYPRSLLFFSSYPVLIFTSLAKSAPPLPLALLPAFRDVFSLPNPHTLPPNLNEIVHSRVCCPHFISVPYVYKARR